VARTERSVILDNRAIINPAFAGFIWVLLALILESYTDRSHAQRGNTALDALRPVTLGLRFGPQSGRDGIPTLSVGTIN
jgi:hypothetical protein